MVLNGKLIILMGRRKMWNWRQSQIFPPSCASRASARSKTGPLIFHQMESIGQFKNLVGGLTSGMIKMPMGWTIDYNG